MATIEKLWFEAERIWITTNEGQTLSRPLEAFPNLKDASASQRAAFKINRFGDAIRWDEIDEDIHISSFFDNNEPDLNNEIAEIFRKFPQLNVSEVARSMGIHKSLLSKYIYGIKRPSEERKEQIKQTLRDLGKELMAV
ncbi:MAG: DUF2442 domain-containing protein [Bacteroidales bacterium]|nr:DUF2442 domain-containing protein [Bacteroidales bacterium]